MTHIFFCLPPGLTYLNLTLRSNPLSHHGWSRCPFLMLRKTQNEFGDSKIWTAHSWASGFDGNHFLWSNTTVQGNLLYCWSTRILHFHTTSTCLKTTLNSLKNLLYISANVWVLHTPNAGQNSVFFIFGMTKHKIRRKKQQNEEYIFVLGLHSWQIGVKHCKFVSLMG